MPTAFETNPRFLKDLLADAHAGRLQLPDFQRSYVWGDEDVRMLLASVLRGFPVGALLTLSTGGEVTFHPRLLAGVEGTRKHRGEPAAEPARELLLDGQQRITSLYGALLSPLPMVVRKPKSERTTLRRYYYLDIARALDPEAELEEAILGLPESRRRNDELLRIDLSSREKELEQGCFPLDIAFDTAAVMRWLWDYQRYGGHIDRSRTDLAQRFMQEVLQPLHSYQMPTIRLGSDTSREAICLVFEKVNVGGKKLDAFELVTAIFAGDVQPLNLREDWQRRLVRIRRGRNEDGLENPVFAHLRGLELLQAVSLVTTHDARRRAEAAGARELPQISAKRPALLKLSLADYRAWADKIEEGFRRAGRFLAEQKILWSNDVPYPAQLVTLAAVFAITDTQGQSAAAKEKLKTWFWRVTLAEDYGTSPETKLARDTDSLVRWIERGEEPAHLSLLTFNRDRLNSLRTRISAAYRGFAALLLREGCRDFVTGDPADIHTFANDPMDVHHVFPRAWCEKRGVERDRYDSILNKTPLTGGSNRAIGGRAPSVYLARIQERYGISPESTDAILRTHLIEPEFLRRDDFEGFIEDRKRRLADLAARAMGLPTVSARAPGEPEEEAQDLAIEDEEEQALA